MRTGVEHGRSTPRVRNSGPLIAPTQVDGLFAPFQRFAPGRSSGQDGHGVGLAAVAAVATAHNADLTAEALPVGGLDIRIAFPDMPASCDRLRHGR